MRSVFGGQVIGQALLAASLTLEDDARPAHSLHAYFLRPGDPNAPIVYYIERIRNGRSFSTRRIVAVQHGEPIFNMDASFHRHEEGLEYQMPMSDVPQPEALKSELELRSEYADRLPEQVREMFLRPRPIELRPVEPFDLFDPKPTEPIKRQWGARDHRPRRRPQAAAGAAGLHLGHVADGHLDAAARHQLHEARLLWRQPRPRHVVPPRFRSGGLAALRQRQPGRDRCARLQPRPVSTPARGALVASTMQEGLVRYRPPSE